MNSYYNLEGKVALVTGGATGIGFSIAKKLIGAGAKVVITGRRLECLEQAKISLGESCYFMVNDITELGTHEKLIAKIEQEIGPIGILVNNAGKHLKKPTIEVTDEEFQSVMQTHVNGSFALTRTCLKYMLPRRSGSILFISSMSALYGLTYVTAYSVAKTAMLGMVRAFSSEYAEEGVRFNAIAPGFINSDMFQNAMKADPDRLNRVLARTPMKRLGSPDDIGEAALFLVSDASSFITGVCLPVDGGNSIGF